MRALLIGAAGMLGRPVARALAQDASLSLTALVRDEARARRVLPPNITLVKGDVRDAAALDSAMRGADAVYINLNTPYNPRERFDPDRDGTKLVVAAAQRAGRPWLLRLSALEASEPDERWWAIERKREADEAVMSSGAPWTVFRPTWFTESLALFRVGPLLMGFRCADDAPLRWISGADFGAQVRAALTRGVGRGVVYPVQGPEGVTLRDAMRRFGRAAAPPLRSVFAPYAALRFGSMLNVQARYLRELLDVSFRFGPTFTAERTWRDLGAPTQTIEDYARSIQTTGDWPKK